MTAEQALIELSIATKRIKVLSRAIGEAIRKSTEHKEGPNGLLIPGTNWLSKAYEMAYDDFEHQMAYVNHANEVEEYLRENCAYALLAHQLIQRRKVARQQLGVAKRRITVMGNKLAAQAKQ